MFKEARFHFLFYKYLFTFLTLSLIQNDMCKKIKYTCGFSRTELQRGQILVWFLLHKVFAL